MSGKVIFSLTDTQASALGSLSLGDRVRAETPSARRQLLHALLVKGLVLDNGGVLSLTDLGVSVAAVCARLQLFKLNGRATGGGR